MGGGASNSAASKYAVVDGKARKEGTADEASAEDAEASPPDNGAAAQSAPPSPSPAASAPSTPPSGSSKRVPVDPRSLGALLTKELHGLTATLRHQELALLKLSRRKLVHRQAQRDFHRSLGAVGALQSLWPDTVSVATHAACRFAVAELQLGLAVEKSATAVAISRGPSLRFGALRRRRGAIEEAGIFLAALAAAAEKDTVRRLMEAKDAKTIFQRSLRAETASAARESAELVDAVRERREAKLLMQQAAGAAEFGAIPENWPILDDHMVSACCAASEEQAKRLSGLDAQWRSAIKGSRQAVATAREKQRVLDSFANLRITPDEVAEVKLQLGADSLWVSIYNPSFSV